MIHAKKEFPKFFSAKLFFDQNFIDPNFFSAKKFWPKFYFDQQKFWPKFFFDPNYFWPNFFLNANFYLTKKNLAKKNFNHEFISQKKFRTTIWPKFSWFWTWILGPGIQDLGFGICELGFGIWDSGNGIQLAPISPFSQS